MELLDMLGIADKASELGAHLSVGQMQRVAIIRALCQPMDFCCLTSLSAILTSVTTVLWLMLSMLWRVKTGRL